MIQTSKSKKQGEGKADKTRLEKPGKVERGTAVNRERRKNLLLDDGSCPAFCSVLAFCVPERTRKAILESCTSRMGVYHRTIHHFVGLQNSKPDR